MTLQKSAILAGVSAHGRQSFLTPPVLNYRDDSAKAANWPVAGDATACWERSRRIVSAEATFLPAPGSVAVAAPTALDSARTGGSGFRCVYPSTMAAAKLSPHPTVSATGTCSFQ